MDLVYTAGVISCSEIGDKTFFIAAVLSARYPPLLVFAGAMGANTLMHTTSVLLGRGGRSFLGIWVRDFCVNTLGGTEDSLDKAATYICALLFLAVGLDMFRSAKRMDDDEAEEELDEAKEDIDKLLRPGDGKDAESRTKLSRKGKGSSAAPGVVLNQAFFLTLYAEWGDRSQATTIPLAARAAGWDVLVGGLIGHTLCTGFAVVAGEQIAKYISARALTGVAGALFVWFALLTLWGWE
eukprot:comp14921_c0_seq1/m.11482 comp14921_c0_seq1/g.11482  ORF comp14921_c0_seq1/g.11482 comp14921_c0_seq1/m.11482 type:complete len:239 (-) comp14921_c0_seq1:263-979(-)